VYTYRHFLSENMNNNRHLLSNLHPYQPPPWALHLNRIPEFKLKLCTGPTPIHRWHLPGVPDDVEVYIKRDDMTGSTLSGNKIRKLEFLLADAISKGCKNVVTVGALQSNHCRATAVAARQIGLNPHLILKTKAKNLSEIGSEGNVLLNRMIGANMYLVPWEDKNIQPRVKALIDEIRTTHGEDTYSVCRGGSDSVGVWGYINAFHELNQQEDLSNFDDVVFACGSGGTAAGLAIGNHLAQTGLGIHGVLVTDGDEDAEKHYSYMDTQLEELAVKNTKAKDIFDPIEGYVGKGYGMTTDEELDFCQNVAEQTGIILDPVYTSKAARALVSELQLNRNRFKGNRVLFIHTGGIFGLYDGTMGKSIGLKNDNLRFWTDENASPWTSC